MHTNKAHFVRVDFDTQYIQGYNILDCY